jgi:hypothetical protein
MAFLPSIIIDDYYTIVKHAVNNDDISTLDILINRGIISNSFVISIAIKEGRLNVCAFIYQTNAFDVNYEHLYQAVVNGQLRILQWLMVIGNIMDAQNQRLYSNTFLLLDPYYNYRSLVILGTFCGHWDIVEWINSVVL